MGKKQILWPGDKIRFLTDILRKQTDLRNQIESRANIAIGLSTAILAFAFNQSLQGTASLSIIIIALASTIAIIFGLLSLKPPKFFSNKGQVQSVFYHTAIAEAEVGAYIQDLQDATHDESSATEQYAREIHNLTKYSIKPKKMLANLAIQSLVLGLVVGLVIVLLA